MKITTIGTRIFISLIRLYQLCISPLLGETCRFHPSCSQYAIIAVNQYGMIKGSLKAIWRILRCNPFNRGGIDFP